MICDAAEMCHGRVVSIRQCDENPFPPAQRDAWDRAQPIYETHPGWKMDTSGCRTWDDLPKNAQSYLMRLGKLAGAPVKYVGIGPDREQTILL